MCNCEWTRGRTGGVDWFGAVVVRGAHQGGGERVGSVRADVEGESRCAIVLGEGGGFCAVEGESGERGCRRSCEECGGGV